MKLSKRMKAMEEKQSKMKDAYGRQKAFVEAVRKWVSAEVTTPSLHPPPPPPPHSYLLLLSPSPTQPSPTPQVPPTHTETHTRAPSPRSQVLDTPPTDGSADLASEVAAWREAYQRQDEERNHGLREIQASFQELAAKKDKEAAERDAAHRAEVRDLKQRLSRAQSLGIGEADPLGAVGDPTNGAGAESSATVEAQLEEMSADLSRLSREKSTVEQERDRQQQRAQVRNI